MTTNCVDHGKTGNQWGYGRVRRGGKLYLAHRWVYCQHNGVSIDTIAGKVVRHTCDNPRCINPEHLILGTVQDNVNDMMERHRHKVPRGTAHPMCKLTPVQVAEIRRLYVRGSSEYGTYGLAKRFGVSQRLVYLIVNNLHRNPQ